MIEVRRWLTSNTPTPTSRGDVGSLALLATMRAQDSDPRSTGARTRLGRARQCMGSVSNARARYLNDDYRALPPRGALPRHAKRDARRSKDGRSALADSAAACRCSRMWSGSEAATLGVAPHAGIP